MKWPWTRNRQLDDAREELDAVNRRTPEIEKKARRAETRLKENQFADRFRVALGGEPR